MKARLITIDGAGEVVFRSNSRSRRVGIRVRPFDGVIVSYPRYLSISSARRLVQSKAEWIRRRVAEARQVEETELFAKVSGNLATRSHRLDVVDSGGSPLSVRVRGGVILVRRPHNADEQAVRRAIRKGVLTAYRNEARQFLPPRVDVLARAHGFSYGRVVVKNLRSRWGSCSVKGTINLNLQLMRLPDRLVDYVILHELAHTRIRNHSKEFWDLLGEVVPNARQLDRELTRNGRIL